MKERIENFQEEKEHEIKPVDCLVVLGRGGEKVKTPEGEVWKPTRYIQELDEKGFRTGVRKLAIGKEDTRTWVAGGTANTIAGIEVFEKLKEMETPPKLLIISAGRPAYLEKEPKGFSEGVVMKEIYDRKLGTD